MRDAGITPYRFCQEHPLGKIGEIENNLSLALTNIKKGSRADSDCPWK